MKTYTPPKKIIWVWALRSVVILIVIIFITMWVWFLAPYFGLVAYIAVLLTLAFNVLYLPMYLKHYSITVSNSAIVIKSGVIIRHERIMPIPRMVYAERVQTLFARAFSVSALALKATRAITLTLELDNRDIDSILEDLH